MDKRANFGKRWGWYHHIRVLMAALNITMYEVLNMTVISAFHELAYQNDLIEVSKPKS